MPPAPATKPSSGLTGKHWGLILGGLFGTSVVARFSALSWFATLALVVVAGTLGVGLVVGGIAAAPPWMNVLFANMRQHKTVSGWAVGLTLFGALMGRGMEREFKEADARLARENAEGSSPSSAGIASPVARAVDVSCPRGSGRDDTTKRPRHHGTTRRSDCCPRDDPRQRDGRCLGAGAVAERSWGGMGRGRRPARHRALRGV